MEVNYDTSSYHYRSSHDHFLSVIIENLTKIGNELIAIGNFIELNMIAIRKALKKHDKTH